MRLCNIILYPASTRDVGQVLLSVVSYYVFLRKQKKLSKFSSIRLCRRGLRSRSAALLDGPWHSGGNVGHNVRCPAGLLPSAHAQHK
jgi:hypothetical protein